MRAKFIIKIMEADPSKATLVDFLDSEFLSDITLVHTPPEATAPTEYK